MSVVGGSTEARTDGGRGLVVGPMVFRSRDATLLVLTLCMVGFMLRVWSINWDSGTHQHPDERHWSIVASEIHAPDSIGQYFDSASSPANPYNRDKSWVYGTFPLFVGKSVAAWMTDGPGGPTVASALDTFGIPLFDDEGNPAFDAGYNSNLVGRLISAIVDTLTIALVYRLGRELVGRRVGLLAATLQTFVVLHLQYSHFFGAEPWTPLLAVATTIGSVRIARRRGGVGLWVATGVALGLAIAAKLSTLGIVAAPVAAALIAAWHGTPGRRWRGTPGRRWRGTPGRRWRGADVFRFAVEAYSIIATVLLTAVVVFRIFQPYNFVGGLSLRLDPRFIRDFEYISDVNSGGGYPWVFQWIDRRPLPFALEQAFLWGLGPALGTAIALGIVWAVVRVLRNGDHVWAVPLAVIGAELLLVSQQFNPVIRYLFPAYPLGVVVAASACAWFAPQLFAPGTRIQRIGETADGDTAVSTPKYRGAWVAPVLIGFVVIINAGYGIGFIDGVYSRGYTRTEASQWIIDNLPPGSTLSVEEWDDALPLNLPGAAEQGFVSVTFRPFAPDTPAKVEELIVALDDTEYVVEASNKLYGAIPQFPAKYPATVRYYDALFDGSLGFERVAEFTRPPSLFGFTLDDTNAEETFTVYDHPPVTIWKKTPAFSADRARTVLNPDNASVAFDLLPRDAGSNALMLRPDDALTQQQGGTWREVFRPGWVTNSAPWLWWLLWLELLGAIGLPLTLRVFRPLIGRGVALAKMVGLLVVAAPMWLGVSLGWFSYGRGTIVVATALAGLGAVATWSASGGTQLFEQRRKDAPSVRRSWVASELVFLAVFGIALGLRYANPDLWHIWRGGEKPMEMAYFTATTRSSVFPPYDPWYGGGYLNYYYWGWYLMSIPTRVLGIVPDVAFNLSIPTVAALASTSVWTTTASLAEITRRRAVRAAHPLASSPLVAGAFGVVLFILIGNLAALQQTVSALLDAGRSDGTIGVPVVGTFVDLLQGVGSWMGGDIAPLDWWATSRVNPPSLDITEFPAWTMLFADLHAHFMGMMIFGLAIAVATALVISERDGDRRRPFLLVAASGALVAIMRMTHTWDFPTIAGLSLVAIFVGAVLGRRPHTLRRLVGQLVVFFVAYRLMIGPYLRSSEVFEDTASFFPGFTTPFNAFVSQWGLFAVLLGGYVIARFVRVGSGAWVRGLGPGIVGLGLIAAAFMGINAGGVAAGATLMAFVLLSLVAAEMVRPDPNIAGVITAGLLTASTAIVAAVEALTVGNDIDRLNTVFKFSLQAWQLAAVGLGFGTWWVTQWLGVRLQAASEDAKTRRGAALAHTGWRVLVVAVVVAGMVFPLRAWPARSSDRFSTSVHDGLAGYAWLDEPAEVTTMTTREGFVMNLADDAAMIDWLQKNVEGSPIVVEAVGEGYQWFGRVTSMTGLPAVIGWDWHQRQQRGALGGHVQLRRQAVVEFYATEDRDVALRFLNTYLPRYVIVGSTEQPMLGPNTLEMFDAMPELTLVYDDGRARVYEASRNLGDAHAMGSSSRGSSTP